MKTLLIGLDSWIIQDGNYPDFIVGAIENFALEFYCAEPKISHERNIGLVRKSLGQYVGHGKVFYVDEASWFLDFGDIRACQVSPIPDGIKAGDYVAGDFFIGIDPFMYREEIFPKPRTPKIIERWQIREIYLETTPWVTEGRISKRASVPATYKTVGGTDAWHDDDGHATYFLECEKLPSRDDGYERQGWAGYIKPLS